MADNKEQQITIIITTTLIQCTIGYVINSMLIPTIYGALKIDNGKLIPTAFGWIKTHVD